MNAALFDVFREDTSRRNLLCLEQLTYSSNRNQYGKMHAHKFKLPNDKSSAKRRDRHLRLTPGLHSDAKGPAAFAGAHG